MPRAKKILTTSMKGPPNKSRYAWIERKELVMLQTMQEMQDKSQKANFRTKFNVLQAIIKAIVVFTLSPSKNQIDTKIENFKKNLKN